jgi:hypothetical protein
MPSSPHRLAAALAAAVSLGLFAPPAGAVSGELRTLYVLATWGPTPFTEADVQRVAAETDAFFRASSSGRLSVPGTVAGPIQLPRAAFDSCDPTSLRNDAPRTLFAGYHRVAFVTPVVDACQFFGRASQSEVLLNGRLFKSLAVHELGHTLGLGHASRWACSGRARCTIDEYGSLFSVMGGGDGDFNAYEKWRLEWLSGILRPRGNATHELGSIEGPTTLPQAFVVRTAASEFWFESRGLPTPSFTGGAVQPPGVAVVAGPGPGGSASPYPRGNLLLPNPNGGARYAYAAGESFVLPRIFRVTVERHATEAAALRFEWLDRVAPGSPRLRARATRRGRVRLVWEPSLERGSGIEAYTVVVDGRAVRTISREIQLTIWDATLRVAPGRHRVGVYATDRAGNRSRAAFARVRVK